MTARRAWLIGGVGAAAALAGIGGALWRETRGTTAGSEADATPDASLWALRFTRPEGGELALADFRGRPLLLNFWATWCPPCVRELPLLDSFQRAQAGRGWQVIGLAVDAPTPVREFLRRTPLGFPVGLAGLEGTTLSRQLGNANGGLPFSVFLARDGRIRDRQLGELDPATLQRWSSLA
jgi:thiol-disulfide isomerase/thioredoxin